MLIPVENLLARLSSGRLGDFLMATPLLDLARQAYPGAKITVMAPPEMRAWLPHPLVDAAIFVEAKGVLGKARLIRTVRAGNFDAVLDLRARAWSSVVFRLAGVPIRIGSTRRYHGALMTANLRQSRDLTDLNPDRHEVEYNCDLARPLGIVTPPGPLQFPVSDMDETAAHLKLAALALDNSGPLAPFVVLNPTFGGSSRVWPACYFAQTAREIIEATGARIVVVGAGGDQAANAALCAQIGPSALDLTGRTTVGELAAILRRSALHLSIDTGTSHLAAAMRTPCVTVFPFFEHWEQRARWRPWQTACRLIGPTVRCAACRPGSCARTQTDCLHSVRVDAVVAAALELLAVERPDNPTL